MKFEEALKAMRGARKLSMLMKYIGLMMKINSLDMNMISSTVT